MNTWKQALFVVPITLGVLLPAGANAQTRAREMTVSGPFEVVISRRGNPSETPYALAGMLTLTVSSSGSFTGELTKGKDENGHDLPGVLFRGLNLAPDPNAANSYKVYGQINGRSVSILFDLGNNQYVVGSGVSKSEILPQVELSFAGGSAIGYDSGDSGDWGSFLSTRPPTTTTTTCTTVSLLGIELYKSCTTTTMTGN